MATTSPATIEPELQAVHPSSFNIWAVPKQWLLAKALPRSFQSIQDFHEPLGVLSTGIGTRLLLKSDLPWHNVSSTTSALVIQQSITTTSSSQYSLHHHLKSAVLIDRKIADWTAPKSRPSDSVQPPSVITTVFCLYIQYTRFTGQRYSGFETTLALSLEGVDAL